LEFFEDLPINLDIVPIDEHPFEGRSFRVFRPLGAQEFPYKSFLSRSIFSPVSREHQDIMTPLPQPFSGSLAADFMTADYIGWVAVNEEKKAHDEPPR